MTPSVWIGTSGWQYADWRGAFYPADLPTTRWIGRYASVFSTVEVNNTFYRLPEAATFDRWKRATPAGFLMAVKASRYLTHVRRLRDPGEPVDLFVSRARRLGRRLGPVLLQLPPNLQAAPDRLEETLSAFGRRCSVAVEFRHPSWLTDDVFALLDRSNAAFVLADRPGVRIAPIVTGGWSYLRFHQGTKAGPAYRRAKLRVWADRIAALPATEVFVYFNNDTEAAAPHDAIVLGDLLGDRDVRVHRPSGVRFRDRSTG
jgi:uncharacterized protein YecE (DUF72 family)